MSLETKTAGGISTGQGFSFYEILRKYVIIFVFIFCIAVFGIINPKFLTLTNILNIFWQNSYLVVATLGMVFLLISGGVDLAAGYELSFGGVVAATSLVKWNLPIWAAVLLGIAVCVLFSAINGILAIKLKINSMMVTLGTMTIYSGISNIFTDQKAIYNLPDSFKFIGQGSVLGIPLPAIIMIIAVVIASFILNLTYFGRYIYAVGGNTEAARLAGIKVNKIKMMIFILGGFFFGVAAIMLVARTGSANASMASGSEFTCLTAAVLGGIAIQGGEGKIWSVIIAVFILGILANGMQIIGLGIYAQYIAKGTILLAAMGFDTYQKTKAAKAPKLA
ncbi:monosaccharide ABC transporter membrane protein (CUT2 family) [Anaerobacterium chartisolvens]|uniref:Monosaccharide ABC transporter membrane protein (CUT2 family) n=1 Tax=Anaerobacterium chartisolvens TaxID=1297424 RepID=A0A369ANL7_9FIRM|nr:ABC transporter permease [Anaerobacterium chartisolvens]RCX09918.1 monosaccharide ABC transporter membrane protein (CUT2 family) [Anaerobacterium chartisolvens]